MSGSESRLLGRWGEALVADDLRRKGWTVEAAGWTCRFGELDLVVSRRGVLAFVEVKLRRSGRFAAPREFVDRGKQERLRLAAQLYLSEHSTALQPRFDVAEVYAPQGTATQRPELRYYENAF